MLYCTSAKSSGELSEWFMEPVLKTGDAARHRGFESLALRHVNSLRTAGTIRRSTQVAEGAPLLRE